MNKRSFVCGVTVVGFPSVIVWAQRFPFLEWYVLILGYEHGEAVDLKQRECTDVLELFRGRTEVTRTTNAYERWIIFMCYRHWPLKFIRVRKYWLYWRSRQYQGYILEDKTVNEYEAIGGVRIGRGNRGSEVKHCPMSLCPPQFSHDQTLVRTPIAVMRSLRMAPGATARALSSNCFLLLFNWIANWFYPVTVVLQ
jgi:hypothetical protein